MAKKSSFEEAVDKVIERLKTTLPYHKAYGINEEVLKPGTDLRDIIDAFASMVEEYEYKIEVLSKENLAMQKIGLS